MNHTISLKVACQRFINNVAQYRRVQQQAHTFKIIDIIRKTPSDIVIIVYVIDTGTILKSTPSTLVSDPKTITSFSPLDVQQIYLLAIQQYQPHYAIVAENLNPPGVLQIKNLVTGIIESKCINEVTDDILFKLSKQDINRMTYLQGKQEALSEMQILYY